MGHGTIDGFELRQAGPEDAAEIRRLTREAYRRWVPVIGREPKPMGADYDAAVLSHRFDLLYLDGALAALIETVDEGDRLLIENLAVAPALQGRGLGSRLVRHAEDIARARGCRSVHLYTNQKFLENIALYLKLGYAVDGEEVVSPGTVRVDMSKTLAPAEWAMPEIQGRQYDVIVGSDVAERDGMSLEVYEGEALMLKIFYSDADGSMTFSAHQQDLPLAVVEWAIGEGKRRLTAAR